MSSLSDQKLIRLIKILPLALTTLFMLILVSVIIRDSNTRTERLVESVKSDYISNQKRHVAQQVEGVIKHLWYEKSRTDEQLRSDIKARVEQVYAVVESIYLANPEASEAEITQRVSQAVAPMRFNDGRGYFFIYTLDGVNVLHPLMPHIEGQDKRDLQDTHGRYVVRELIDRVTHSPDGASYYRWWFPKPGSELPDKEFEKIGYAKRFAPLNWFIGTGEYFADVERDIQKRMKQWLSDFRFDRDGYVFAMDQHGQTIAHVDRHRIGERPNQLYQYFLDKIDQVNGSGAGFVSYTSPYVPHSVRNGEKISYVKLMPDWGWLIGAGVYMEEVDRFIDRQVAELTRQNESELTKVLTLCLLLAFVLTLLSILLSRYIERRFYDFHTRIDGDFARLKESKMLLAHQAQHDNLTGLPNRSLLESRVQEGITLSREQGKQLAVMFVDLDNFKKVNDQHGHKVGDELLKAVASKFARLLRREDTVARFGGDEFVFCFPMVDGIFHVERLAEQIRQSISGLFALRGAMLNTGCSIGVSMYPNDGENVEQLISNADIMLFRAKSGTKGKVRFYDEKVSEQVQYDFLVEDELKHALDLSEIEVYYQPQVHPRTGIIEGVEALCRWNSHKLGFVAPDKFIAVAEQTGMIFALGEMVFRQACLDIKALHDQGIDLVVSVNISPKQVLQRGFVNNIYCMVNEMGVDCRKVTLEVTENVFMEELAVVKPVLDELRELGFGISLDDFGTGYSSLSYLNALPISEIKIDRLFVDKMLSSSHSENLVRSIIAIGQSKRMQVVAEGVETVEQQMRLNQLGATRLQGYLFSKPVPFEQLVACYFQAPADNNDEIEAQSIRRLQGSKTG